MGISAGLNTGGLYPGVCTSTTRPASPYEGQMIYETNTDKVLVWNGSAWYPSWNQPWGLVAYTKTSTSNTTYTTETVMVTSSSFTAVADRYYKATYIEGTTYGSVAAEASSRIRLDSVTGTLIGVSRHYLSNTWSVLTITTGIFTASAGSHTVVGTLKAESGTGTAYRLDIGASIMVEDVGPV